MGNGGEEFLNQLDRLMNPPVDPEVERLKEQNERVGNEQAAKFAQAVHEFLAVMRRKGNPGLSGFREPTSVDDTKRERKRKERTVISGWLLEQDGPSDIGVDPKYYWLTVDGDLVLQTGSTLKKLSFVGQPKAAANWISKLARKAAHPEY